MPNGGVVVVVSGQDDTGKVFDAIEKNLKRTTEAAHETESSLAELGERAKRYLEYAGIALGVHEVVDAFKELIGGSLEMGEQLSKASEKTGLAVETLSTLHYAAKMTGSDFDALTSAVGKMGAAVGEAADGGNKKADAVLKSIGLNAKELASQADGTEIAFKRVAEAIAATENPVRRLELAKTLLGKAGQEEIDILTKVGRNWDEYKSKAEAAGLVLNEKTAKALEETHEKMQQLRLQVEGAGVSLTEGFNPAFSRMLDVMSGGKSTLDTMKELGQDLGKVFAFVAEAIYSAAAAVEILFATAEGSALTEAGRRDTAAAGELIDKAKKMHDIAFGQDFSGQANGPLPVQSAGESGIVGTGAGPSGTGTRKHGGFDGADLGRGKGNGADKLEAAQKALDAAQLRLDAQMAQLRAQLAKAAQDQQLAQLEADHQRNLISDRDFYERKLAIEKAGLDAQQQAAIDKQKEIDAAIEKLQSDATKHGVKADGKGGDPKGVEDESKILELRTRRAALDGEIAKIEADSAKVELDAAQKLYELSVKQTEQTDELAAKREQIRGGSVDARLHQSADAYDLQREKLTAEYGADSQQVSDARFALENEQGHIRATGAEETEELQAANINARRTQIGDAEARGTMSAAEAQRERIALDEQEAQALEPVLAAYEELANGGDLQAAEKVTELQTRIAELKQPVDDVSAHIRESLDGAFESLFENLDQGTKAFESFAKSVEKTFEQAAYKQFMEPLVQGALGKLIPNRTGAQPGFGDAGIGGVNPIPNVSTDIGGGAVRAAASIGSVLGIPGLGGLDKKGGGASITITLENESGMPLKLGDLKTGGNIDKDQVISIMKDNFEEGGFLRSLVTGFHV